jgi:tripartite-type tricarboxylate transporter receptor subunit TctC
MPRNNRRRVVTLACAAIMAPALGRRAFADAWPKDKIIRAVVPFAAGSTIDIIARIVLDPLSTQLGQTVVVENRGGAGGAIGSAAVAKSEPDGYTLLINASAHSAAPAVYPNLTKRWRSPPYRQSSPHRGSSRCRLPRKSSMP